MKNKTIAQRIGLLAAVSIGINIVVGTVSVSALAGVGHVVGSAAADPPRAAQLLQEALNTTDSKMTTIWVALFVGAAAAVAMAWLVSRSVNSNVQQISAALQEGSNQLVGASSQVASSGQNLSQGATEQAGSLEQISASIEEMSSMTQRNSENATRATVMMTETTDRVERSNAALKEMLTSMNAIKASSEKVAKINKTIDEIAFQTNILALNAAVEAARAGEAGMGFAVVADEVRNLAQRSAVAAKDTALLIEESIDNSQQGSKRLDLVANAISEITDGAVKVRDLLSEVNEASKQQSQGITQVSQAVSQVSKVTQQTAASAEESAAASQELSARVRSVQQAVNQLEALSGLRGEYRAASEPVPADSGWNDRPSSQAPQRSFESSRELTAEELMPMETTGSSNFHSF